MHRRALCAKLGGGVYLPPGDGKNVAQIDPELVGNGATSRLMCGVDLTIPHLVGA